MELERGHLKQILTFPLDIYHKYNGYLGILGFDSAQNDFVIASKSTIHGDFANTFRKHFYETVSPQLEPKLMKYMHTHNVGMVYEVVDPEFDPHIIAYDKAKIVLLDVIYRTPDFKKYSYEELHAFAQEFGFEVKERTHQFHNWDEFYQWYLEVSTDFSLEIEGYLLEDANGFMTKIKLPYYKFWKWMRSCKDKIAKGKALPDEIKEDKLAAEFCHWAKFKAHELDLSNTDIITLRNLFYKETKNQS